MPSATNFFCALGWYNEDLSDLIHIPRIVMYRSHFCFPSAFDRTALHFISFLSPLCQHNDCHLYCTWVMLDWPPWNQTFTKKLQVLRKSWFPPHFYKYENGPPPAQKGPRIFRFFQNSPKSPKGVLKPKFSILSTKKSKIVILVPKITQIRHSAIFRKNQFFNFCKVLWGPKGPKNRYSQNFWIDSKNCL